MTWRIHPFLCTLVLSSGTFLLGPALLASQQSEKKTAPTAEEIAKEWRYPGVGVVDRSLKPLMSEVFYIESYGVKADFGDVWNHFAAKCGSTSRYAKNRTTAVMSELKGPDKGHFMIFDGSVGEETHFGQSTEKGTIHVEIRKAGEGRVNICFVAGIR